MRYLSTRGKTAPAEFTEVLVAGLAADGGLAVPEQIPQVSAADLEQWRELTYPQLAARVIGLYATDIPTADLEQLTANAYSHERFSAPEVVPVTALHDDLHVVGLSEGPTLAFKDLAMQFLGQVLPYVLRRTSATLNILGATSGDTGSAAEEAFRGAEGIGVFMLSPQGRMSDVQRAQMYSIDDPAIHNLAVDGVFDDCQNLVKDLNNDADFKAAYSIGAVNSINFGRISAQIVYYVWAWLRMTDDVPAAERADRAVSFAVPSGNFGNLYSGHLARRMGVPIHRLIVATNENNVLDEFFRTGVYAPRSREATLATSSPSMDISKASNLERFVWELLGTDAFTARWPRLQQEGRLDLSDQLARFTDEFGIVSGTSTHADRVRGIHDLYEKTGRLIDPHTADAYTVASRIGDHEAPCLVLETAKPEKFRETVAEAVGEAAAEHPEHILALLAAPQHVTEVDADADALREYIAAHAVTAPGA